MRLKGLLSASFAVVALGFAGSTAADAGWDRYHGRYYGPDPYAYTYIPRGYYPYYNSNYWRPAWQMRARPRYIYVPPDYYASWGYPVRGYRHYKRDWRRDW